MENTNLKGTIYDMEAMLELNRNQTHEIHGNTYTEKPLTLVEDPKKFERPRKTTVNSLSALCSLLSTEIGRLTAPIFVEVQDHRNVIAYTTYRDDFSRDILYHAQCDTPVFEWRNHLNHEQAIIAVQSRFVKNEGTEYLLELLSSITVDNSVTSNDNGVTQAVEVKKGVALKQKVTVRPVVSLSPYRTFLEVRQPESNMLVRVNDSAEILLVEADGGMWKMAAKEYMANYLKVTLKNLIEAQKIIVLC